MDSGERRKPELHRHRGVRIETLGIIIGSALLGGAAAVSILRAQVGGVESISMVALLSFLLMLGLTSAAIVLAVVAVSFSRMAERSIERKAEEMSTMRATLMAQNVAAVKRIEASVRRSSKGIADTIYEKFETLTGEIRESLPSRDVLRADVTEAVERSLADAMIVVQQEEDDVETMVSAEEPPVEEIEEPVVEEIAEPLVAAAAEPAVVVPPGENEREKIDRRYEEFKDIVLLGVANYPGVIARKIGEGHYRTEGDELVDGAFALHQESLAVCTFCTHKAVTDRFMGESGDSFNGFLKSLYSELKKGHFHRIFLAFDGPLANTSPYAKALNDFCRRVDAGLFARFELFEGSPDVIIPQVTERVSQLMAVSDDHEAVQEISFRRTGA